MNRGARKTNRYLYVCVCSCDARVCVRMRSHVRVRNNRKGVQYFLAQIRYPRTLMGNCALCDCDPITILPLPTSSHTLPSAPRHSSCHEKVIYVNPYDWSSMLLFRGRGLHRRAQMVGQQSTVSIRTVSSAGRTFPPHNSVFELSRVTQTLLKRRDAAVELLNGISQCCYIHLHCIEVEA